MLSSLHSPAHLLLSLELAYGCNYFLFKLESNCVSHPAILAQGASEILASSWTRIFSHIITAKPYINFKQFCRYRISCQTFLSNSHVLRSHVNSLNNWIYAPDYLFNLLSPLSCKSTPWPVAYNEGGQSQRAPEVSRAIAFCLKHLLCFFQIVC